LPAAGMRRGDREALLVALLAAGHAKTR
jgi:hypothetical protein